MKKLKFIMLLGLLGCLTMGFQRKETSDIKWLDGDWSGVKYQLNMDRGWQMLLRIETGAQFYDVSYPELGCSGQLELLSVSGTEAVFIEKINGSCLSDGYIILTKVGDKFLSFTCLRDAEQRLASYCTLKKVSI